MTILTLLDAAHGALSADPENDTLRLRFYERLADGELFLLLEREVEGSAQGSVVEPRIFPLESGPVVLVFDREERLAEFSGGIAPYAALPGRVIAGMLRGQGIGLGVNLGVAPSEMLLPAEALDWLAGTLDDAPDLAEGLPEEFLPPTAPEALIRALREKLALAGGAAVAALLCGVRWQGGRRGHVLAVLGAAAAAEAPLARALREALVFSGIEAGEMDVIFVAPDSPVVAAMARVGLRFDPPQAPAPAAPRSAPAAPGSNPDRPPRLR